MAVGESISQIFKYSFTRALLLFSIDKLLEALARALVPSQKHLPGLFFALAVVSRRRATIFWVWCQSLHSLHLNQILTTSSKLNLTENCVARVKPILIRYAVGVHRRVDIYSIESAGIEYSIDMKVTIPVQSIPCLYNVHIF